MAAKYKSKRRTSKKRTARKGKGKKRLTFKKKGAYKKKKTYSKKKSWSRKTASKLTALLGDQATVIPLIDKPAFTGTTNADAKQFVWGSNCVASQNISSGQIVNLMLDAGPTLQTFFIDANRINTAQSEPAPPSSTVDRGASLRLIRKSCSVECRIVNCEQSPVELWEYRIRANRDQTLPPGAMWYAAGQMEQGQYLSTGAQSSTVAPSALANGGYATPIGVTPMFLHCFTQQYHIVKTRKWELAPGKHKKISYKFSKPKIFNWANLCSTIGGPGISGFAGTGVPYVVRKGQVSSLFFAKGTLATNAAANAGYKVGISNVNLGFEYIYKYHWKMMLQNYSSAATIPSIPGFSANASIAPLPITNVWPLMAISTGPVPAAAGTQVNSGGAFAGGSITDANMTSV